MTTLLHHADPLPRVACTDPDPFYAAAGRKWHQVDRLRRRRDACRPFSRARSKWNGLLTEVCVRPVGGRRRR